MYGFLAVSLMHLLRLLLLLMCRAKGCVRILSNTVSDSSDALLRKMGFTHKESRYRGYGYNKSLSVDSMDFVRSWQLSLRKLKACEIVR